MLGRCAGWVLVIPCLLVALRAQEFQAPPVPREAITAFEASRKDPLGAPRREQVEAFAKVATFPQIPLLLGALDHNAAAMGKCERELERLDRKRFRAQQEVDKLKGSEPGPRLEKARSDLEILGGDLNHRREQILALERECEALRGAVQQAASRSSERDRESLVDDLVRRFGSVRDRDDRRQLGSLLALLPSSRVAEALSSAVRRDSDPVMRADAVDALGALGLPDGEPVLVLALEDSHQIVRAASIMALRRVGGKLAVPALIQAIARESGRLREDVLVVLRYLTGVTFHANIPLWEDWWKKEESRYERPRSGRESGALVRGRVKDHLGEGPADGSTTYYGLRVSSHALVYLIDVSGSMNEPASAAGTTGSGPRNETKLDRAKREVIRSVQGLPSGVSVNLLAYSDTLSSYAPQMVKVNDTTRRAIVAWVRTLTAYGQTNIYDALDAVLSDARGSKKHVPKDMAVDTILLMTDGHPTAGKILDGELLAADIQRRNHLTRIVIHTFGVGSDHSRPLLERLSKDSLGIYSRAR